MPAIAVLLALMRLIFSMAPFTPEINPLVSAVMLTDAFKSLAMVQSCALVRLSLRT
jgi:hypothetical protein